MSSDDALRPLADVAATIHANNRGRELSREDPRRWVGLARYMQKCDTLLSQLAELLPAELASATKRSKMMLTCYPGGGARYTRHCDNANRNGRRLTAILYLNPAWRDGDGGELRVFGPGASEDVVATVSPLSNRLLIFWSDARAPHEVLPAHAERFAATIWFFDVDEKAAAEAAEAEVDDAERLRIEKEIEQSV